MEVKDIMTTDVRTVTPETTLKDVAAVLIENGISGVPVCGADGRVLGVVSEADILFKEYDPGQRLGRPLAWLIDGRSDASLIKAAATTAAGAMTAPAITIGPERPVAEAARELTERNVNRLPVVKGETLVGIVTRADLVRAFTRSDEEIGREIRDDVVSRSLWLDPDTVTVTVECGAVTLAGEVEGRGDARLLGRLVACIPGIVSVQNDVTWRIDDAGRRCRALARSF